MNQIEQLKNGIFIGSRMVTFKFVFCADWKMFAQLLGIKAANSNFFCPWCLSSKDNREKLNANWNEYPRHWDKDSNCFNCKGKDTIPSSCENNHGWNIRSNLLKEPFNASNCLLDSLHGVLRSSDIL